MKFVAGGYYVLAIEESPDAHLLSADHLGIDLTGKETITLRFQNHTPATEMRLKFTTEADPVWDDAKSRAFAVVANDNESRTYSLDLSAVPAWKGRLRQLRLDLATGKPLTGTCRIRLHLGLFRRNPAVMAVAGIGCRRVAAALADLVHRCPSVALATLFARCCPMS